MMRARLSGSAASRRAIPLLLLVALLSTAIGCGADNDPPPDTGPPGSDDADGEEPPEPDDPSADPSADTVEVAPSGQTPSSDDDTASGSDQQPGTDLADGRHAVLLHAVDIPGRTLTVDVIQFLTGQAAIDAYHADHPEDPGNPDNDYYVLNVNPRLRTLPVAGDDELEVVLLRPMAGTEQQQSTWNRLLDDLADQPSSPELLSYSPFWLTLDGGVVTRIEEQYLP